jgi:hypothetical protein
MDITILHPEFMTQLLEMRISGYWSTPRILLNGVMVKRRAGEYAVLNDAGHEVSVRLNSSVFNMLPQLLIDGEEIRVRTDAGWTQFAGWKKSIPLQWGNQALQFFLSAERSKKLNKTVQG